MKQKDTMQNPWAGLSSYEDPVKSSQRLKFCGRDSETFDVSRLIDDNFFVTLYGKSGIGKTSLLNAGVFPALRRKQYTPLSLRLGMTEEAQSFQEIITANIERAVGEAGGSTRIIPVVEEQNDRSAVDYLWNWFARRQFLTAEEQTTFPVVVFDQFEEVFRQSDSRIKTEVLLAQIHYLIDETHALGDCIVEGEEYSYDFNFRFVLSIREDDLYRLEDSIDNCALTALKRCRYRLRSLSEQEAREAILLPGEGLFRAEEQDQIVQTIIGIARNKEDQNISTNLLSLVCNRIFVEFQKKPDADFISRSLVDTFVKGNLFERFYDEATKGFSNREKSYIEEHLVDSTGRRNSIPESDFLLHVPNGAKLLEGDTRILQRSSVSTDGGNYRIELIHDSFCEPLSRQREKREKRRRARMMLAAVGVALVCAGITWVILQQKKAAEEATWKMMENRARFVATQGQELIDNDDYNTASLLALEILPESLENPDKPYVVEAERLLRDAMRKKDVILKGYSGDVNSVAFSPDGKRIALGLDNTIIFCDAFTGLPIGDSIVVYDRGGIEAIAFSPDGKRVASGSGNRMIRIWDVTTGKQVRYPLTGPDDEDIYFIAFSPDGRKLMVFTFNTTSLWDIAKGTEVDISSANGFSAVAFSPDSKRIVTGLNDNTIRIWDATTGRPIGKPLVGHTDCIESVAFSPDGKHIVSGSSDMSIRVWDVEKEAQIGEPLIGHKGGVDFVTFSPDGKHIVSKSNDKTFRIWTSDDIFPEFDEKHTFSGTVIGEWNDEYTRDDGYTGGCHFAFSPDGGYVNNIKYVKSGNYGKTIRVCDMSRKIGYIIDGNPFDYCFSPDGKYIASTLTEKTIGVWDVSTGKKIGRSLTGHTDKIHDIIFSPDGKRIVSASDDKTIRIWDATSGRQIGKPLVGHRGNVLSVEFSPDGKRIVSISDDNTIRVWDAASGKAIGNPFDGGTMNWSSYATFSPDGKLIVSKSSDDIVHIWDVFSGKQIINPLENCIFVLVSPKGNRIVSVSKYQHIKQDEISSEMPVEEVETEVVRIWDVSSGKKIGESFNRHRWRRIEDVVFTPNSDSFLAVSNDGTIEIWNATTGKPLGKYSLEGYNGLNVSLSLSSDVRYAVAGSDDGFIHVWDVTTGKHVFQPVKAPSKWISSCTFSPDNKYILSRSDENILYIWDAATGKQISSPLRDQGFVNCLEFSPNGRYIVSGLNNSFIHIWDFPPLQELINETRKRFKDRQLTPEERRKYYLE